MAEKHTVPKMEETPGEELTPKLVMFAMSLIRSSDPFTLTPTDIAKFFRESEDSESQAQENKVPTPDSLKESPEKSSK
ncbi:hypothetical protein RHMOL_Rhmol13G0187900 [Rhododendron molle]|uniref:Uncharacterized protein n=1 Tax=Rhododendron molle TaxID=49168 RepID=A0ACC0L8I0_RHOML|nr:hypothetical protein RHMOL_Rhmol13G0187900 [Rhododendron molle]